MAGNSGSYDLGRGLPSIQAGRIARNDVGSPDQFGQGTSLSELTGLAQAKNAHAYPPQYSLHHEEREEEENKGVVRVQFVRQALRLSGLQQAGLKFPVNLDLTADYSI